MRSVYDNLSVLGFAAAFNTASALICTGATVDTKGYNSAALRVFLSTTGSSLSTAQGSSLTAVLQESSDGSTWTTATDNTGASIGGTSVATTTAVLASYRIEGLNLNRKRYLRVVTTANQYSAGVVAAAFTSCAVLELGRSYQKPVTTTTSNT